MYGLLSLHCVEVPQAIYAYYYTYAGIYLSLNGTVYSNNSVIMISEIGNHIGNGLQCVTDRMPCCTAQPNISSTGDWFFPDGGKVPSLHIEAETFGRNRGSDGTVNLHRVSNDVMTPTGQYCCVVPDAISVLQKLCATVGKFVPL